MCIFHDVYPTFSGQLFMGKLRGRILFEPLNLVDQFVCKATHIYPSCRSINSVWGVDPVIPQIHGPFPEVHLRHRGDCVLVMRASILFFFRLGGVLTWFFSGPHPARCVLFWGCGCGPKIPRTSRLSLGFFGFLRNSGRNSFNFFAILGEIFRFPGILGDLRGVPRGFLWALPQKRRGARNDGWFDTVKTTELEEALRVSVAADGWATWAFGMGDILMVSPG